MASSDLLASWLKTVATHTIVVGRSSSETAVENTTIFAIEEARAAQATPSEIVDFILKTLRIYCLQAARVGLEGWFYAWCDEMSGTLRCSACNVPAPTDLPFSCELEIHLDAQDIAETALASPYAAGIPRDEMKDVDWTEIESDPARFVLPVYVRRLVQISQ